MAEGRLGKDIGLDVEWRLFGTGPAMVAAFEKGELDLAYIGLPPAIIGISRGVRIVCIAGGHVEGTVISGNKGSVGFPEFQDLGAILDQFRGRNIGVPGNGSIHDVILAECLERYRLREEVEVVHYQWSDEVTEAIVKGNLAAAVGTPALAIAIQHYADGRILYPPSLLWPNNPSYGIIADRNYLRNEGEGVEKFLVRHEDATSLIRDRPGLAAEIIAGYVGFIDKEFVMDTLRVSPKYCAQLTEDYIFSTMEFVRVLKRLGYVDREIPSEEIFDTTMIHALHPSKDHYGDGIADSRMEP